jgi:hypothetical protein
MQNVSLRSRFAQGSESRVIDLDGGLRTLPELNSRMKQKDLFMGHQEWLFGQGTKYCLI